jgi:DNA-binding ferritin-like protein
MPTIDFDELDRQFKDKAKNVITSMYDFYHDFGVINESEYVQTKKELDAMNVSNIFFQLKAVKTAIKMIMDEITSGNTHPRMFESLSTLNSQFSDTIKAQANYILFLEESAKKTAMEAAESNGNDAVKQIEESVSRNSDFYITSNPKNLIKEIQETNPITDEERDEFEIKVGTNNINPHNKENLMIERDIEIEEDDDSRPDGYEDIIDMI